VIQTHASATVVASGVSTIPSELQYIALLFALFVLPSALQRYRIPAAITSFGLGIAADALGWFVNDPTVRLLSTFGIVALFLFAGLDIDGAELRRGRTVLIQHGIMWCLGATGAALFAHLTLDVDGRSAALLALALMTPSTGFILSSLQRFGLAPAEQFAVKSKAIAAELIALASLFVVLQSTTWQQMAVASAAMLGIVVFVPIAFRIFARTIVPYAPRSEFAFLLMVAIVSAYATRRLGVYYLVGAFIVGVAAQRFRKRLAAMSTERMVNALEAFGSVFIPFYFFNAGMHVERSELSLTALGLGIAFAMLFAPLRVLLTATHRRLLLRETTEAGVRVGVALLPTLVFTLVLAEILRTRSDMPDFVLGALIVYTVLNTVIPAFVLRAEPPAFEAVEAADVPT
jgi:Kef-type K+ transport system membrane component KefB